MDKGDKVTINYIEKFEAVGIKLQQIAERYFFTCTCIKCVDAPQGILGRCRNPECALSVDVTKTGEQKFFKCILNTAQTEPKAIDFI